MTDKKVFVLDKNRKTCNLVSAFLTYHDYKTFVLKDPAALLDNKDDNPPKILITEVTSLLKLVPGIANDLQAESLSVIVYGDAAKITLLPKSEQWYTISTPLNFEQLLNTVADASNYQDLQLANACLQDDTQPDFLCSTIIGKSRQIKELFEILKKVANSNATVLIQGESGTGKELAARAIHQLSERKNNNFVPINCAAIPEDLLESELFGHVKGSFTGAYTNRAGRFEIADKGTLLLDEIGDMKANLQTKLLRVLQSREFEPVGSTRSQKVDVRIVAATNQNLEELVASGAFREDLYYRLSVIPVTIPPLRERRADIPLLIAHFLRQFNNDKRRATKGFSQESLTILSNYHWPGNVRELENLVERMVTVKEDGFITPADLPEKYLPVACLDDKAEPVQTGIPQINVIPDEGLCLNSTVDALESRLILMALAKTGGNKKEAAELLNLKRTTLLEKIKKKKIPLDSFHP